MSDQLPRLQKLERNILWIKGNWAPAVVNEEKGYVEFFTPSDGVILSAFDLEYFSEQAQRAQATFTIDIAEGGRLRFAFQL